MILCVRRERTVAADAKQEKRIRDIRNLHRLAVYPRNRACCDLPTAMAIVYVPLGNLDTNYGARDSVFRCVRVDRTDDHVRRSA